MWRRRSSSSWWGSVWAWPGTGPRRTTCRTRAPFSKWSICWTWFHQHRDQNVFISLIPLSKQELMPLITLNMVYNGRREMSLVPACRKLPKKSLVPAFNFWGSLPSHQYPQWSKLNLAHGCRWSTSKSLYVAFKKSSNSLESPKLPL